MFTNICIIVFLFNYGSLATIQSCSNGCEDILKTAKETSQFECVMLTMSQLLQIGWALFEEKCSMEGSSVLNWFFLSEVYRWGGCLPCCRGTGSEVAKVRKTLPNRCNGGAWGGIPQPKQEVTVSICEWLLWEKLKKQRIEEDFSHWSCGYFCYSLPLFEILSLL